MTQRRAAEIRAAYKAVEALEAQLLDAGGTDGELDHGEAAIARATLGWVLGFEDAAGYIEAGLDTERTPTP